MSESKLTQIDIVCLFPQILKPFLSQAIIGQAQKNGRLKINVHNLRKWTKDKRKTVDDKPYGGGPGMVLKADALVSSYRNLTRSQAKPFVVLTSPSGAKFDQKTAKILSHRKHLLIYCGRYEGVDQRFIDDFVDREISIGDYILAGGELAAAVVVEATVRLISGVLGNRESLRQESFEGGLLEYPQYTRPEIFRQQKVPEVLLSGNHSKIKDWRQQKSLEKTKKLRPDLLS